MLSTFFNISDLTRKDFEDILDISPTEDKLKKRNIGMLFQKYSTRTRLSFAVGINQMGGNAVDIRFDELNISRDESFEDTFKAMNCYLDGLIFRTTDHNQLINASKYFHHPIINALSDKSHPCQIISDIFTLKEYFGHLKINILWLGDINNVCFSLIEAVNLFPEMEFTICSPRSIINKLTLSSNSNIKLTDDIKEIKLSDINCVMTDVFISMNDENSSPKIDLLRPYSVNSELMDKTRANCVFMHCLPAQIGMEVSEEVFRSSKSIVWKQAYNRMIVQKKLLQFIYQ